MIVYSRLPAEWLPPLMQDSAVPNIMNIAVISLLVLMWAVWLALFSEQPRRVRWWPLGTLIAGLLIARLAVRVDEVWGGLIPYRVSWRWQPPRDYGLQSLTTNAPPQDSTSAAANRPDPFETGRLTAGESDFPEFLGRGRLNAVDGVKLETDWNQHPPQQAWRQPVGSGWSGFAASDGHAVTMEQRGAEEVVSCYDVVSGKLLWATAEQARHETMMGGVGPRSTPTIAQGHVYALGATGILRCLQGRTGEIVWRVDLREKFQIPAEADEANIAWGRSSSPLVLDDRVIVPVGGATEASWISLVAFEARTGAVVWQGGHRQVAYASPTLVTLAGQPQILTVMQDFVTAHDPTTGQQLWEYPWPGSSNANASVSQAWAVGPNRVFVSKGYGQGATLFEVARQDSSSPASPSPASWSTSEVWANRRIMKTKFNNPTLWNGYAYGIDDGVLCCVALETGQAAWRKRGPGHGQLLRVGESLLIMTEDGELVLVDASPEAYRERGRISVFAGQKAWNNLCLYGNHLLLRTGEEAACFKLETSQ